MILSLYSWALVLLFWHLLSWLEALQPSILRESCSSWFDGRMGLEIASKCLASKRIVSPFRLSQPSLNKLRVSLVSFNLLCTVSLHGVLPYTVVSVTLFETTLIYLPTNERCSLSNGSLANSRIVNWARRWVFRVLLHFICVLLVLYVLPTSILPNSDSILFTLTLFFFFQPPSAIPHFPSISSQYAVSKVSSFQKSCWRVHASSPTRMVGTEWISL